MKIIINGHRAPLTPAHIHALALAEESKKRHDAAGSQGGRDGFKATLSIVGKPIGEHTIFQALDATLEVAHRQVTIIQRSAVADMVGGRAPPPPHCSHGHCFSLRTPLLLDGIESERYCRNDALPCGMHSLFIWYPGN